jgi:hypothetical protein
MWVLKHERWGKLNSKDVRNHVTLSAQYTLAVRRNCVLEKQKCVKTLWENGVRRTKNTKYGRKKTIYRQLHAA